jgi:putative tryptophan/tyrosine transport system substrate-binding protein
MQSTWLKRRECLGLLAGAAAWPLAAHAQLSANVARVGFLRQAGPHPKQFDAFRDGLRAAGYIEGQNLLIEARYAGGAYERLPRLAAELVRAKVDVIVVDGPAAAIACKEATPTIPIVFTLAVDPVADRLVATFARPGRNLTGLTMAAGYGLAGKQVELLKDMVESVSRLAVLANPDNPPHLSYVRETERVASALGLELRLFEVIRPDDLTAAFTALADWRANGVVTIPDGLLFSQRERVVEFALKRKLSAVYPEAEWVEAGGLASYGPSLPDLFRRAAGYVDKILKGANPGDLPVEQPSKFELVVNLRTAQAIGLIVGRDFQLRADEVIE